MNMEALYGEHATEVLPLAGSQLVTLASLQALPSAVSPLDTKKSIKATQKDKHVKTQGWSHPLAGLIVLILVVWMVLKLK